MGQCGQGNNRAEGCRATSVIVPALWEVPKTQMWWAQILPLESTTIDPEELGGNCLFI